MLKKINLSLFHPTLCAGLVLAAALIPAAAQNIVVKMATLAPQGSNWHQSLVEMADQWQKITKGQVTVRLYPGGVAGDDSDVVRKMRLGTLNAGLLTITGLTDLDRSNLALEIPMAFAGEDELLCVLDKMAPELENRIAAKGFVLLGWSDGGFVRFFSKSPVRTPDDLKKLKMFVWTGDDLTTELWKSGGFNPVPLPSTEISTALQTGLVQAVTTTTQAAVLLNWYDKAPNMLDLNWAVLLGGIVINKATWDKIPAEYRPALQESARATGKKLREAVHAGVPKDVVAMQKRGLNVVKPSPSDVVLWSRTVEGVYGKIRGSVIPADAFDTALKHRDACRQQAAKASRP